MEFFKNTKSFELVTILEKMKVNYGIFNTIKYIIEYSIKLKKFDLSVKKKIRKSSNDKKIKLFTSLFLERFYLEGVCKSYGIDPASDLSYTVINNNIVADLSFKRSNTIIHIEYGIYDKTQSIYVLNEHYKGVNMTADEMKFKLYHELFMDVLNIVSGEICVILGKLLLSTIKSLTR